MEFRQFIQQLKETDLEKSRCLIAEHVSALDDQAALGNLLAAEALDQVFANPATSLKLAELLIFLGEHFQHPHSKALGLKAKGDVLKTIGLHQAAMESLDAAGAVFLSLGDEGDWARSRISWIISCAWLGETEKALQEAQRARETFIRIGEPYWACVIAHNIAAIYDNIGRYELSIELYQDIIATYSTLTDQSDSDIKRSVAIAQNNLAFDLALLGRFEESYRLLQQALTSFIALKDTSCVINTEMCLADLDYTQGYYSSALRLHYDALELMLQETIDEPPLLALLKLWMANCYMKLNRVQEACKLAEEAVAIQRQLGISLQTSNALREYAATLIAAGKMHDAMTILDEAIILFNRGGLDYYTAITKLQQAELLLEMGHAHEAYEQAEILKTYFDEQNLISRSVRASLVMIGALMTVDQTEAIQQAIVLAKQVAAQANQHNLQEAVYKSNFLLGQLFDLQGSMQLATKYYATSIDQIERILDHLVSDLSPDFLHTTWIIYEKMIAHCLKQSQFTRAFKYLERARSMALRQHLQRAKTSREQSQRSPGTIDDPESMAHRGSATILRLQKEINDWQEQYRQYSVLLANATAFNSFSLDMSVAEQELKHCEAKLSELFERLNLYQSTASVPSYSKHKPRSDLYRLNMTHLRRHLGQAQCLLAYFTYEGKLVIFLMTAEMLMTYEVADGATKLERLMPLLYAHLQPMGWPDVQHPPQEAIQRLLQKFYEILILPVVNLLPASTRSLLFVPFGPLHDLPFQALYDGTQFLIERFQISYLPASSLLIHLNNAHKEATQNSVMASTTSNKAPLIFGYAGNRTARRTLNEATLVAELLKGNCYLEQEATIARLIEEAPGCSIIHIATHGRARLDAPHFSSVLLADGEFNAIDAIQLNVKDCHLVTLSGCETGKAVIGGGDEQLGLVRAFLAAGAKSLLISLWPVEDYATDLLMQQFYQHLLNGDTKEEALRAAQCHLIHHSTSMHSHPYFWAAFRLVGDAGFLSTGESNPLSQKEKLAP